MSRSSGRRLCTLLRASSTTDLLSDVRKVEPMLQAANSSEDEKTLTGIASVINSATEQHLETQCSYLVYTVKMQTAKGILLQLSYSTTAATLFCLNYQIRWQNTKKAIKSFFLFLHDDFESRGLIFNLCSSVFSQHMIPPRLEQRKS